jgi:hypothetical protein
MQFSAPSLYFIPSKDKYSPPTSCYQTPSDCVLPLRENTKIYTSTKQARILFKKIIFYLPITSIKNLTAITVKAAVFN